MKTRLSAAMRDAMSLLGSADVAGATAAIQRALAGQAPAPRQRSEADKPNAVGFRAPGRMPAGRRLGAVVEALRSGRAGVAGAKSADAGNGVVDDAMMSRSHTGASGRLDYRLYVPALPAGKERALVVMLHGCTQGPDDFARGTQMNRLADEFGLVIAYPHQPKTANAQGCWNWFDTRHQQRGAGEPALLAGLAQELAVEFGIDRARVFAAGLSAGGAMADILASTYPEVFAAVGIHSGLPAGVARDVMSAFAAMKGKGAPASAGGAGKASRKIIFHGAADATVASANGEHILNALRSSAPGSSLVTSRSEIGGRQVARTLLDRADGAALAEHWLVEGGGHAWSGGDRSGSFTDAAGPDASREFLRFFLAQ